ncbi:DEAD/DEAH box helicase [Nocardia aurantia]|nr:DEAD/DEAH box helicase family protein [Nocardia aurantia]
MLARRIAQMLLATPFMSAAEIKAQLSSEFSESSRSIINSVLYARRKDLFEILGTEQPPIWAVREEAVELVRSWQDMPDTDDSSSSVPVALDIEYSGPPMRAWQQEAIDAWIRAGHRGIIEAVTGSGKTAVGIRAVAMALDDGRQAAVLVPSIDLQKQWYENLRTALPNCRIGRLGGDAGGRLPERWDVLVSTVQTGARRTLFTGSAAGRALLVADEVHRYGASAFAQALTDDYDWRLGLTATLERTDNAVEDVLLPYFGHQIAGCDYARAQADGILAPVKVALVGVDFTPRERAVFDLADDTVRRTKDVLIHKYGAPENPFGEYMAAVQQLAKDTGGAARFANRYLKAFSDRRETLADCSAKLKLVRALPSTGLAATRSIFFTERAATAGQVAVALTSGDVAAETLRSGLTPANRDKILRDFRDGELRALAAPRVLDEGIDVPDAQVGVVLAASRTRRQMIQRMGRVIRPKADGRAAIFVVMFVRGTSEDPGLGAHEAFLDELQQIADEQIIIDAADLPEVLQRWLGTSPEQSMRAPTDTRGHGAAAPKPASARLDKRVHESAPKSTLFRESNDAPISTPSTVPTTTEDQDLLVEKIVAALEPLDGLATAQELFFQLGIHDTVDLRELARTAAHHARIDLYEMEGLDFVALSVDRGGASDDRLKALKDIVFWASESSDPLWEFRELVGRLGPVRIPHERLIRFAATVRGTVPSELIRLH